MPLPILSIPNPTVFVKTKLVTARKGDGIQHGLVVGHRLNKGSNSAVYAAKTPSGDDDVVVRKPMHDSDTRKKSAALAEAAYTLIAANAGVTPHIHDMWYCASGTDKQRRGLHVVMQRYPMDLHDVIAHHGDWVVENRDAIAKALDKCAVELSRCGLLTFDIKSGNVVLRKSPLSIKFIDFSDDYCERCEYSKATSSESREITPTLAHVASRAGSHKAYESVIRLSILILLSASLTTELHQRRRSDNINASRRHLLNPLTTHLQRLRKETPAHIVRLIKYVLRSEDVRQCAEHYNGNRNACVRRMFDLSNFNRDGMEKNYSA